MYVTIFSPGFVRRFGTIGSFTQILPGYSLSAMVNICGLVIATGYHPGGSEFLEKITWIHRCRCTKVG